MDTIYLSKTGATVYMPDALHKQTPTGEQGATAGLIAHLASLKKYRIVYHGQVVGTLPEGVIHVQTDLTGVSHEMPDAEHEARCRQDYEIVKQYEPRVFVNMQGYSPSWCVQWNPRRVTPQCTATRYCAPQLSTAGWLKLPRIVMNADLRCYPREGEMSHMWSSLQPVALMSQITRDWPYNKEVAGKKYHVREVECGMENWHTVGRTLPNAAAFRDVAFMCVSHAHVADGFGKFSTRIMHGRADVWRKLLLQPTDIRPWLKEIGSVFYGVGWSHTDVYDEELMYGAIEPQQVVPELQRAICGVVVTPWGLDPYVTSKLRYYAWSGCVPIMYGRSENGEHVPHMGDGVGRYVPRSYGDPWRARDSSELKASIEWWLKHPDYALGYAAELERKTRPDFSKLEQCIDDILTGRNTGDDSWWRDYGGYRATA